MRGWGWKSVHHPDQVERVVSHFRDCIDSGETWEDTFPLRGADGEYRWFLSRAVPLRGATGAIEYWFGTNTDITEQRSAEHQIHLLLREVQHRSKNMLAIVQSIARQTAKTGEDFVDRLERRIAGLSANQDLLVSGNWTPVAIADLVDAQMAFLEDRRPQVDDAGPPLRVRATAAEAIAMALHEMATNAEKYGALSVPDGRVEIRWSLTSAEDGDLFRMTWQEFGGPPVAAPPARGFGSRILEAVPASKLGAVITTEFPPEGFRWELACPIASVRDEEG
jgi:two-component sensor histidine kinase